MIKTRLFFTGLLGFWSLLLTAQVLPYPILFCTQIPNPQGFASSMETFGNQHASMSAAPRGGDLYIRYTDGTLKNLTATAGFGQTGQQGANSIAVRDPHVHWSGTKALFSMAVGAPTQQYQWLEFKWKLYEITGLGLNETPVITLVPNQPTGYNNIQPIYGTDERIIFSSDRPRGGWAHLYPQHDEYESSDIVTGLWKIDPTACDPNEALEMLTHSPSGDFTPIIDHWGRVIFTRWDHLQRDQQADADIMDNAGYGTFNYQTEAANAPKTNILPDIEVFPEPRSSRTDLLSLPAWANTNGQTINMFNPWMMNENGTDLEILNHLGRHEMDTYIDRNFTNDDNLDYYGSYLAPDDSPIRAMFHIQESPGTPGLYFGTEAGEFGSHASGMIVSVNAPPGTHPEDVEFTYITHPDTRSPDGTPSPNHTGLYRDPLPISNGQVVVMHTSETDYDENIGSSSNPLSRYDYRLRLLVPAGNYFKADTINNLTGAGISKTVTWWTPDLLATYSGKLWETYPVEVRARAIPDTTTLNEETLPAIEQALFDSANVNLADFRKFLRRNNLSMLVTRDVTSRDDADHQQPFNLKVFGSAHQTVDPDSPTPIYEVKYLQYIQGDQIRGKGGIANPQPGRRVLSRFLHDSLPMIYNQPTTGAQGSANIFPDGSVAALVPANRAVAWQLTDVNNKGIVRERLWLSAVPGEIRVCSSCHGESTLNQANLTSPQNPPQALTSLLNRIKVFDRDADGFTDINDAFPTDPTRHLAEPLSEEFVAGLVGWLNQNPDNDAVFWAEKTAVPCYVKSAMVNNRKSGAIGKVDKLRRFVHLQDMDDVKLSFDVAYARYNATKFDRLRVIVVGCDGSTEVVYDKSGSALATAPDQTALFQPLNCDQWRNECINLSAYAGKTVELVFENINGFGNRLFLDNVHVLENDTGVPLPLFSGEENPCTNATEIYSFDAPPPPGLLIFWEISGGTILSGQGTAAVTVKWGLASGEGKISVRLGQTCLATSTQNFEIQPGITASIAADPANGLPICSSGNVNLSTPTGSNLVFQWYKNDVIQPGATAPNFVAATAGNYKVVVENTVSTCAADATFSVLENYACNPNFCTSSGGTASEWIQSFAAAGISNVSGNDGGYGNFLDVSPLVLPKGTLLTYNLSPGFAAAALAERWRIWVDYNKDGDFADAGELLFSIAGTGNLTKNYTIPNTRPSGVTRMRVSMKRGAYPANCGNFTQGEVEDYVVIIGSATPASPPPTASKSVGSGAKSNDEFTIFPNPADRLVTLAFSENGESGDIQIFDALGRNILILRREAGENQLTFDVSRWPPGLYFAKIGEMMVGRFAVQR